MIQCPECKGEGSINGFDCPGFKQVSISCRVCKGAKQISKEQVRWIEAGHEMRESRRKQGVSVREQAKIFGMSASDYSEMEFGIRRPFTVADGSSV